MAARPPGPASWVGPLTNILKLEEDKGFNNTSVVGGMDRFIQLWAEAIAEDLGDSHTCRALLDTPYIGLTREERPRWVEQWRSLIARQQADSRQGGNEGVMRAGRPGPREPESPGASSPEASPPAAGGRHPGGPAGAPADAPPETRTEAAPTPEASNSPASSSSSEAMRRKPPGGLTVDTPVDRLRGVDEKQAGRLKRLDVYTVRDLLYLFPRRHLDYSNVARISELIPGEMCTVVGTVWEARNLKGGPAGKRTDTEAVISDDSGNIRVRWFGQRYLAQTLKPNRRVAISGRVDVYRGQITFDSPDYELLDRGGKLLHTGRLVPVYPLTEGLTGRSLRRITWQALQEWLGGVEEPLPEVVLSRAGLPPIQDAIINAHYPDSPDSWENARRRLAFDELFTLQLAVLSRKRHRSVDVEGVPIPANREVFRGFFGSLPFPLTGAQRRCIREILEDLKRGTPPMNRLLQGEVGSGKTVVALAASLAAAAAGHQAAIMVPTEVLAEQHFETISRLLGGLARPVEQDFLVTVYLESLGRPVSVGLLTGSTRRTARRELTQMAAAGNLDILVGTQALIQSGVAMPNLALAVADEQHRFGVLQRGALRSRGEQIPHALIMSATPIPRTLSLTLYGDLDISTLDELPAGRQEVATRWVSPEKRQAAYGFVRNQVQEGRQGFVICPLVDESDAIESKAATEEYERLSKEVFPDLRVGLLHGRMAAREKDSRMRRFRDGELDILVSTAVVEVGIDVPNASVMLIEGADRFGLAQLHQFRGRVGRGEHKSYCLLLSDSPSETARERLNALEQIHDGFRLAEVDLQLRGPGDFFGTRQSGLPSLRMAHVSDQALLQLAREEAARLYEADPDLTRQEHTALSGMVQRFLGRVSVEAG